MDKHFFTLVMVGSILFVPSFAYAYADPGSGIFLWQLLASGFIGLLFYLKRIITFIRGLFGKNDPS